MKPSLAASPTRELAHFAVHAIGFPALARQRAVDAITDCVGCMLAGSREALANPLLRVLPKHSATSGAAPALLVGTQAFAAPADAALFNGAVAHALDYDDTNHPAYAHPSAVLVPALLALAPVVNATGTALIDAYIIGLEVFGKLGRALNTAHYKRGWHATATFGTLAAAMAAGRVLGLDEARMTMALGIAASSAGGLRASFGTMMKPLHAGQAARNGVLAALLAREGFAGSDVALEHEYGFGPVFNAGVPYDFASFAELGRPLEILSEYGLALKMYPSCGATHPGIEAGIALHGEIGNVPLRHIRAGVCEMAFAPLIYTMPNAPLEGKFSLHFCLAAALVEGRVGLTTFTDAKIHDPVLRALVPKITMELEPALRDDTEFATVVSVETERGKRYERTVMLAAGKPERWFTPAQLHDKFADCASRAWPEPASEILFTALRDLDRPTSSTTLLQALQGTAVAQ
ncbi:MAG: MmgE/PrpD family protein [Casimicrobiaceae bacterium]